MALLGILPSGPWFPLLAGGNPGSGQPIRMVESSRAPKEKSSSTVWTETQSSRQWYVARLSRSSPAARERTWQRQAGGACSRLALRDSICSFADGDIIPHRVDMVVSFHSLATTWSVCIPSTSGLEPSLWTWAGAGCVCLHTQQHHTQQRCPPPCGSRDRAVLSNTVGLDFCPLQIDTSCVFKDHLSIRFTKGLP